jgi:DNA-binding transcriptional LysR family regulator
VTVEQLRRFVTLAEELSFTRAAQRLHIAQQVLSTQTRKLEEQVGAPLFNRSTHHVELTPAGQELLMAARAALEALQDGVKRAREAADATEQRLRIGFLAQGVSELQPTMLRELRRLHPKLVLAMRSYPFTDPLAGLLSGESDVAFLRHPPAHRSVRLERVLEEERICMVPADHPLAEKDVLRPEDLAGLPMIAVRGFDTDPVIRAWTAEHALLDLVGERPVGAVIETPEEWLQAAEDGLGFTSTPESVSRFYPRPGIRAVPMVGVSPLAVSIGWRKELDHSPLVRDLVALAHEAASAS